jgi:hypothetical protein
MTVSLRAGENPIASVLLRSLLTMASTMIAPVKAPTASLKAVLALIGTRRITAAPAFQHFVTVVIRDVDGRHEAGKEAHAASHDESEVVDPGMNTRRQLRYGGAPSAGACRRRIGAERKGARRKARGARGYRITAACAFMQESPRADHSRGNAPAQSRQTRRHAWAARKRARTISSDERRMPQSHK